MKYVKRFIILFLLLVIYINYFNHFIGAETLTDVVNSMFTATVLFTTLFIFINTLTIFFYMSWKQWWKWIIVLILSIIPFSHWLYLYPWTAARTYPVFVHYLAKQGLSTDDIAQFRAFPDLKFGGYYYGVHFKKDRKYLYEYSFRTRNEMFFDVSYHGDYENYFKDAKVRELYTRAEYLKRREIDYTFGEDFKKYSIKPVSERIQRQKLELSATHPLHYFQIRDID